MAVPSWGKRTVVAPSARKIRRRVHGEAVAENEELIRAVLEEAILIEGYEVEAVRSGPEAFDRMDLADFDVVITDVVLPGGLDGLSLADRAAGAGIGVIVVSGDPNQFDRLRYCGHAYLHKPFRMAALVSLIERVLRRVGSDCETRKAASR
jgi:DNA-binding response OmpR family regulator